MFTFVETNPPIKWPVKVTYPVDNGKTNTGGFTALFTIDESDEVRGMTIGMLADSELLQKNFVGWEDIDLENGGKIKYSEEKKQALMKKPFFRRSVAVSYTDFIYGFEVKN